MPRPKSAALVQKLPKLTPTQIDQLGKEEAEGFSAKVWQLLNRKERLFSTEYLRSRNQAWAARKSGYSGANAEIIGAQLRIRLNVEMYIQLQDRLTEIRADVDLIRIIKELAAIGLANVADAVDEEGRMIPFAQLPRHLAACVTNITTDKDNRITSYKFGGKLEALEKLGKHLGMFSERMVLSNPDGSAIETGGSDRLLAMAMIRLAGELGVSVDSLIPADAGSQVAALENASVSQPAAETGSE